MKIKNTTVQINKKVKAKEYAFELEEDDNGMTAIGDKRFSFPNADGCEINGLMSMLPRKGILTVTVTISEE
jgi:hypothetical protein